MGKNPNQKAETEAPKRSRSMEFDTGVMCACGSPCRRKFALPRGGSKNARLQHTRQYKCKRGHTVWKKRG